jgi:hypothetical protein
LAMAAPPGTIADALKDIVMSQPAPPSSPEVRYPEPPLAGVNFRLWQIVMSAGTVVMAGWFFTLNPMAGIIASFVAKHVLVAILAAGLTGPAQER